MQKPHQFLLYTVKPSQNYQWLVSLCFGRDELLFPHWLEIHWVPREKICACSGWLGGMCDKMPPLVDLWVGIQSLYVSSWCWQSHSHQAPTGTHHSGKSPQCTGTDLSLVAKHLSWGMSTRTLLLKITKTCHEASNNATGPKSHPGKDSKFAKNSHQLQ